MFNTPSNRIELIETDEFRKFYRETALFLEEWLIAKCGATGLPPRDIVRIDVYRESTLNRRHSIKVRVSYHVIDAAV